MAGISMMGKIMIMIIIVFLGFQLISNQGLNAREVTNKSLNFSSVLPEQETTISKYADEIDVPNEVVSYFYTFLEQAFKDDEFYENVISESDRISETKRGDIKLYIED